MDYFQFFEARDLSRGLQTANNINIFKVDFSSLFEQNRSPIYTRIDIAEVRGVGSRDISVAALPSARKLGRSAGG
jgi:hypothetical protein